MVWEISVDHMVKFPVPLYGDKYVYKQQVIVLFYFHEELDSVVSWICECSQIYAST